MLYKTFSFKENAKELKALATLSLLGPVLAISQKLRRVCDVEELLIQATLCAVTVLGFDYYRQSKEDPIFDAYYIYKISSMSLISLLCGNIEVCSIVYVATTFAEYFVYYSLHSCANKQSFERRYLHYENASEKIVCKLNTNKDVLIATIFAGALHTALQIGLEYNVGASIALSIVFFSGTTYGIASKMTDVAMSCISAQFLEKIGEYLPSF